MIKKTTTYVDYNDVERTEDNFFNLSKAEIMEMEMSTPGGLAEKITRLTNEKNVPAIFQIFKDLILKAYGKKSDDGRRFIKSKELAAEFEQTEAFSMILTELATDAEAAAAFVNGIVPANMGDAKAVKAAN